MRKRISFWDDMYLSPKSIQWIFGALTCFIPPTHYCGGKKMPKKAKAKSKKKQEKLPEETQTDEMM